MTVSSFARFYMTDIVPPPSLHHSPRPHRYRHLVAALLALVTCCVACCVAGHAHAGLPSTLRFEHLNSSMGLPQDGVFAMAQDEQGFIWMGTQNGLARYDGYQVTPFAHQPGVANSLADNWVRALLCGADHMLWIATPAGLQKYDPIRQRFTLYHPADATDAQRNVTALAGDGHGGLWLGTSDGLLHFDPGSGRFRSLRHSAAEPKSLSGSVVRALALDATGALWVALKDGLDRLAPGAATFEHFGNGSGKAEDTLYALRADGDVLWVGSEAGLQQWRLGGATPVRRDIGPADGMPAVPVRALTTDQLHNLWIGTAKHGLFQWRPRDGRVLAYEHRDGDPHSPAGNSIISLMQDRSGSLWAGTSRRGVSRVDLASGGFTRIVHSDQDPQGLSDNTVTAIAAADAGRLWLSTGNGGLNLYDPASGQAQVFRHRDGGRGSLPDDRVAATVYDPGGRLWIAAGRAVAWRDPASGRYTEIDFRRGDGGTGAVHAMICDRSGRLWIGTLTGLYSYDTASGAVTSYRRQGGEGDAPASNIIYELKQDHEGRIWVGTAYGLDRLDPASGRWRHFRHDPVDPRSLNHDRIWVLYEDRDQTMWVGTAQGLNRAVADADGATRFISYPFGTAVDSIEQDAAGQLWVATDGGLLRFDPARGSPHWYHSSDGISEGDFQTSSSLRAADGVMYFGSNVGGVTAFRPDQVHGNSIAPAVVLTSVRVLNQEVRHGAEPDGVAADAPIEFASTLTLAYRLNVFSIEFAALHYAASGRNQYAYQLVGFDKDWVATSAGRRFATYTNLDPGVYVFRVKASNKDGVWAELAHPLRITITPPFWKTWWFRLLIGGLVAVSICAGYLARVRSYTRREEALTANVRERDAAVEAAVEKLHATQQQLILREKMASVGSLTAGIAHEINNPVNFAHVGAQALDRELEDFRAFLMALAGDDADADVVARLNQRIDLLNNQVGNVIEGTSRIRNLVKDLLSFSRPGEAQRKPAAIGDSLLATVNLVRSYYADLVEIDCRLDVNPELECWQSLLNQVFMNMIVNACQAIEARFPRGSGRGRLRIRSGIEAGELTLEFRDNGCGIPPDQLSRIFEPFYTTKEIGEGTGLGLSTSFGIVAQHGGRIAVASTPGSGSTFTIHLPLHPAPSRPRPG